MPLNFLQEETIRFYNNFLIDLAVKNEEQQEEIKKILKLNSDLLEHKKAKYKQIDDFISPNYKNESMAQMLIDRGIITKNSLRTTQGMSFLKSCENLAYDISKDTLIKVLDNIAVYKAKTNIKNIRAYVIGCLKRAKK